MKVKVTLFLLIPVFSMNTIAQIPDTSATFKVPDNAKKAEVGLMVGYLVHYGYLYELDSANIDIMKMRYVNNHPRYSHFQIPASQINYIKIEGAKKDKARGALIGTGVGFMTGLIIVAVKKKSKSCDEGDWYWGKGLECFNDQFGRVAIVGGTTVAGTIFGAIVGYQVSVTIPINGNQLEFESAKPKLAPYVILRN